MSARDKGIQLCALLLIVVPIAIAAYLLPRQEVSLQAPVFHASYVIGSSLIALALGIFAFLEYREKRVAGILYVALGLVGVSIIYGFHGLITPGASLFPFPDKKSQLNAFVFFGDCSRFWLALLIFSPGSRFKRHVRNLSETKVIVSTGVLLILASVVALLNPAIFPNVKTPDGADTYFSILFKVVTLVLLGIEILRYHDSYQIKPNLPLLSLIVGSILIVETVVIFMISKPWTPVWWLAHNLFLLSYMTIGAGVLYAYLRRERFEYFDVLGQVRGYVEQLKESNKQLVSMANTDGLTGLANRSHFVGCLRQYLKEARDHQEEAGLLYIDLDQFKSINDAHGHDVGDEVLKATAGRILGAVKAGDLAARIGGDEFVVFLRRADQAQVAVVAARIVAALAEPISTTAGPSCRISASVGAALFPEDGSSVEELVRAGDLAMYHVKAAMKNDFVFAREAQLAHRQSPRVEP